MAQRSAERQRPTAGSAFALVKEAVSEWSEDKAPRLGAALAYYTAFSIAPLLIIVIAIAAFVLGSRDAVQTAVLGQLRGLMGDQGAAFIQTAIEGQANKPASGIIATLVGVVTLLFGALGAFGQLQDALNTIWEVKPKPGRGFLGVIRDRLLSLTMVLGMAFFLLVSLVVSAGLTAMGTVLGNVLPVNELLLEIINFVISLAVVTLFFALIFKYLPDAKIAWRDVWIGAALTALLFNIGKTLIGLYLGNASITSTYGAAGSLVVLLLWVYYSTQILFFGAELTQVYANRFGSRVVPAENATRVTEAERAEQGLPHRGAPQAGPAAASQALAGPTLAVQPESQLERALPGVALVAAPAAAEPPGGLLEPAPLRGREYLMALLTFAAGLSAGAMVALQTHRERVHGGARALAAAARQRRAQRERQPGRR